MSRGLRRFCRLTVPDPAAPAGGCPDSDLVARFVDRRDEAAFELLLLRHGPMVLGACRRVLADPNDADDAFQATFLVLARKAGSVGRAGAVAAWLHRVAHRAALRVRADRVRRATRETPATDDLPGPPAADPVMAELGRVLDEEVASLPARHRAVFVLCGLGGKTGEEAARVLGCPPGTVSSRLTRAREKLRDRLTRRGFAPAVVAVAGTAAAAPAVPARLADTALTTALAFAAGRPPAGQSPRPVATAEGVMRAMFLHKVRLTTLVVAGGLFLVGGLLAGAGAQPTPPGKAALPLPTDHAGSIAQPPSAAPPGKAQGGPPAPKLPAVRLVSPVRGGLDRVVTQRVIAEAVQQTLVTSSVSGRLKSVAVGLGDRVKAGQVLAEIDAPDLVLDEKLAGVGVLQAEGRLGEAAAGVRAARAEVSAARAAVKQREAVAGAARAELAHRKTQLDRVKALAAEKSVAVSAVEDAEARVRAAESLAAAEAAGVAAAEAEAEVKGARLGLAEAVVMTAGANVEAAKVGQERARLARSQTQVTAPFDGVVVPKSVGPGEAVSKETPLFSVARLNTVRVVVSVPQECAPLARPGLPVGLTFDALPASPLSGTITRVGPDLDWQTQTMRAEVDLPNPGGRLLPGLTGDVTLQFGKGPADTIRVPVGAATRHAGLPQGMTHQVYVYRDGRARLVPVRLGYSNGTEVEVLAGLTGDDRVVADPRGLHGEDLPVRLVEPPAPPK